MNVWKYSLWAVLAVTQVAQGQTKRWISLVSEPHFQVELDTKTIAGDTGFVVAWVRGRRSAEQGTDSTLTAYTTIDRDRYNCATREIASLSSSQYDALGKHTKDTTYTWPPWEGVTPGTIREGIFDGVCDYAKEHNLIRQAGFLDRHEGMISGTAIALVLIFAFGAGIGWASTSAKARWADRRSRAEKHAGTA